MTELTTKELFDLRDEWYARAKKQTPDTINDFIAEMLSKATDYNTMVYTTAAASMAVTHMFSNQLGISCFQAGCIQWEMIDIFGIWDKGPKKILCFRDMLYPHLLDRFDNRIIDNSTFEYLKREATSKLAEDNDVKNKHKASKEVRAHWEILAAGKVPHGITVDDETGLRRSF